MNKWVSYAALMIVLFAATLVQESFLVHLAAFGVVPNLVFVVFFVAAFFEKRNMGYGMYVALAAGFFLDLLLPFGFGSAMVVLLLLYFFIKLMQYFLKERQGKYRVVYFAVAFLVSFLVYTFLLSLRTNIHAFSLILHPVLMPALLYNGVLALLGFYVYKTIDDKLSDRQLTLF